ncbi:PREDICTED: uncharacterized protein LOC105853783 isoform X4 [Condylura cristata]|uniref:uncharacterized protein LOC105853783 isoform X4 n=1 Tax=Condylura cristata TaxID=143302 RepID=UPI0006438AEA|nr:PREDICTED: uncharacterized protein LOC105853783 isoform X4 [Condylura cristata]
MRFLERAPKAAPRRPAPGRAQCVGSTRPLHPERDTAARGSCQRGLDSRAPPRGRPLPRSHPPATSELLFQGWLEIENKTQKSSLGLRIAVSGGDVNRLKFINTVKFYCISGPQDLYPGGGAGGQADSFAPSDFPADTWPLGHSPLGHGGREPAGQRQTAPLHLPTTALPRAATGAPRGQRRTQTESRRKKQICNLRPRDAPGSPVKGFFPGTVSLSGAGCGFFQTG